MSTYVRYCEEFKLAICKACKTGLSIEKPSLHFRRYHKETWRKHKTAIQSFLTALDLRPIESNVYPATIRMVVDGLAVKDGWCCSEKGC